MGGQATLTEAQRESKVSGLFLLGAGTEVARPTDLMGQERLKELIQTAEQAFDMVLLDCPPAMAVADASIIANVASSVLFVVGSGMTSRAAAQVAIDRLTSVGGRVVGVVLNRANVSQHSEYYAAPKYLTDEMVPRKFRNVVTG